MIAGQPFSIVDVVMLLITVFLLGGCAPAATGILNTATGDDAQLVYVVDDQTPCGDTIGNGVCFDPAGETAVGVIVDLIADADLTFGEPCEATDVGADCRLGDVDEPTFVQASGVNVTAQATYRRVGSNRVFREFAVR